MVGFASALSLHWFVDCGLIAGIGLHRVLSTFEESFRGQQTLCRQLAVFLP